jgi:hypothetical protein
VFQYSPISIEFMLDALLPLTSYSLKSKSSTLKEMAIESIGLWAYLAQGKEHFTSLGHFTKDEKSIQFIVQYVFENMGAHQSSPHKKNLSMKIINTLLNLYAAEPRVRIFNYLYQILQEEKNDRGISVLTSSFYKDQCDKSP